MRKNELLEILRAILDLIHFLCLLKAQNKSHIASLPKSYLLFLNHLTINLNALIFLVMKESDSGLKYILNGHLSLRFLLTKSLLVD